jgi:4-amino-4-deoxy-L-arabinose transferase-like glycosyltransferase
LRRELPPSYTGSAQINPEQPNAAPYPVVSLFVNRATPVVSISLSLPTSASLRPGFGLAFAILGAVTALRLIGLYFSTVDLFYDESQYWAWSRELAFGYVTKPPLLAWTISAASHVCGDSEACVRAPSPLFYFGTSLIVYAIARELYDARTAFFAALSLGLAPGVAFSARIISTDVPLLFFWSLALLAYLKLLRAGIWRWAVLLGLSLGAGLLAKYAMVYFLLGIALAAWLDGGARRVLFTPMFWVGIAIAVLVVAPNAAWNLEHKFATLHEVSNNAIGDGIKLNLSKGLEFAGSQFGVFGPILFAVLLTAIARITAPGIGRADRLMLAFAIPPLALIGAISFVTHANANWAATAFISGTVVAVALLVRRKASKWLAVSIAFGLLVQGELLVGDVYAAKIHLPVGARGDLYARTLGWRSFAEQTGEMARRIGARSIVGDMHFEVASLLYYWRDQPEQILAWLNGPTPQDNFELTRPFTAAAAQPILYVTACYNAVPLRDYFSTVEELGAIVAPSGPVTARHFSAFKLAGPRGPIPPRGECDW